MTTGAAPQFDRALDEPALVGAGLTWDRLPVGSRFRTLNRTITETDLVQFVGVTGMVEVLFTDLTFAERHGAIAGRVVPAACTYAIVEGLIIQAMLQTTGLALLGVAIDIVGPVLAGDTVHADIEVRAVEPTGKLGRARVTTFNRVINQRGEDVLGYQATRLMRGANVAATA